MLELPDVTLVCIYTIAHELSLLAVDDCLKLAHFGDVKLFSDQAARGHDVVPIKLNPTTPELAEVSVYQLPKYIKTSHVLFIHWDSWILDPSLWQDKFLRYDYIGAPWWYTDGYNVGNSGFTIRSRAILDFMATHREQFPFVMPEDHTLCRVYRSRLPQFTWAPEDLAWQFAFERTRRYERTFGFHGIFNWHLVLDGDRLAERVRLAKANPYVQSRVEYPELIANLRRVKVMGSIPYAR